MSATAASEPRDRETESLILRLRMKTSLDDIRSAYFWRAVFAEFLGTLLLVFIGCASTFESKSNLGIAFCFGISVATIVWNIAHISGGHINPAVTFAMLITRRISLVRGFLYVVVQMLGGVCGAAILLGCLPLPEGGAGVTQPTKNDKLDITPTQAFGIELIITFVLVFTVFATCDTKRDDINGSGPLTIGLSVTLCHIPFVPITGASMNPARSFGPALVYNQMEHHWIYWIGPMLGGLLAGLMYEHIFSSNSSLSRARAFLLSSRYDGGEFDSVKNKDRTIEECPELDPVYTPRKGERDLTGTEGVRLLELKSEIANA